MEAYPYEAETNGIRIRVRPVFVDEQSSPDDNRFLWAYHIEIENRGRHTLQLMTRHWRITDGRGMVNFVDGDGVVGEQPVLKPGQSHDYVSGCPLTTPTGSMEGHYTFIRRDGEKFAVAIPFFPLAAPATAG